MKKLQSLLKDAGETACLAMDYAWIVADFLGAAEEKVKYALIIQTLIEVYDTPIMNEDFFVNNPVALMKTTARLAGYEIKADVQKKDITKYSDLPEKGYACVRHDSGANSHFVVAKDRYRVWDSIEDSNCVKTGAPASARIVTLEVVK